ncbi:MAG: flagellar M-ring protein FliF, partial [bacterium]|nr:flagellar M-ring protein FliF [bacterium]
MDELKRLITALTLKQKISLLVVAVAVAGGIWSFSNWTKERDFKPLYTGLAPEDAGAVVARLQEAVIEYRVGEGGTTILVPSALVAETRLQMASSGLPQSGRIGFELFDKTNFGATDFAEQVNYHRALEGELERSVISLSEVERARVHLTLPKDSVFLESRRPAKGSVMLKIRVGAELSPQNVLAIAHLVASAVEGLDYKAVSVLDMRGNLLSKPRSGSGLDLDQPSDAILEYRNGLERSLLAKINSTLEPLLGPENFRASISVDCDFTSGEESKEVFDPTASVMSSSQRTEDTSGVATAAGVPGTASNLPRAEAKIGSPANRHQRKTENILYQSSRTVRRTRMPQGDIKRISVALLVDHAVRWEGTGDSAQRVVEPPSEEQLNVIRELVTGAAGLNLVRGDKLIVESLPFESTRNWQPPEPEPVPPPGTTLPLPSWLQNLVGDQNTLILVGVGAGAALLLFVLVALFMLRRRSKKKKKKSKASASVQTEKALPAAEDGVAMPEEGQGVAAKMTEKLAEQAVLKAQLENEALKSLKIPTVKTKKTEVL